MARCAARSKTHLERLRAFGGYADGHLELMREGVRRGVTLPAVILEGYEPSIASHVMDDPEAGLSRRR